MMGLLEKTMRIDMTTNRSKQLSYLKEPRDTKCGTTHLEKPPHQSPKCDASA